MDNITKYFRINVNQVKKYQDIDGFGVNINSKYWNEGKLIPVMDLLVDDLGANLYRLDACGKSNWIDPEDQYDASILNAETYKKVYGGIDFKNASAMGKYLNAKGIEPYITISGISPKWMCHEDGKTLKDYDSFAEMIASYAHWLRNEGGVKYRLFCGFNETDIGPPEGPFIYAEDSLRFMEGLADKFDHYSLQDLKFVFAEQANYNLDYVKKIIESKKLQDRIGVFSMHAYSDFHCADLIELVSKSNYKDTRIWMGEFGDLDQSNEKEWYVSYTSFQRLMRLLEDGMNGAIYWDAFDNYHDHDEAWTTFGLIKNAWNVYIPKKRYYALKQLFRFVKPGFRRIEVPQVCEGIQLMAFESGDGKDFTLVGMNDMMEGAYLNLNVNDLQGEFGEPRFEVYRTTVDEDCAKVTRRQVISRNRPYAGIEFIASPKSIFTVTTVK